MQQSPQTRLPSGSFDSDTKPSGTIVWNEQSCERIAD
jgi:hypothetical protein